MAHARIDYDACPLCACEVADEVVTLPVTRHPLFRPGLPETLRWLRCSACAHLFASGHFDEAALALLFSGANASQLPGSGDVDRGRQQAGRVIERVVQLRGSAEGRWLDVGFGNGALLLTAAEFGFRPTGLDVRVEAVERLRELGCEAHCAPLQEFRSEAPFDVVSLADVIEHLPFPARALAQVRDLLAPEGLLFLSTPNFDSFHWRALDLAGKNPYWTELEHLHIFTRARLQALLREHGFTPLSYAVSERYLAGMELVARRA